MNKKLEELVSLSNRIGKDPQFVLAGGGNTSYKDPHTIWVKPSGVSLATITADEFLPLDRQRLQDVFSAEYPTETAAREARVKAMIQAAVRPGFVGRPSVESCLHNMFAAAFVAHSHPPLVNGLTCSVQGAEACAALFPETLWIGPLDPGYTLAWGIGEAMERYRRQMGRQPAVIFAQNHGLFVAADSTDEIARLHAHILATLRAAYEKASVPTELAMGKLDSEYVFVNAPKLRQLMSDDDRQVVVSSPPFKVAEGPLTPDHIVYAGSYPYQGPVEAEAFATFAREKGSRPIIASLPGAVFACGETLKNAQTALALARDAALVAHLANAFGGVRFMSDKARSFIETWEAEAYRRSVSSAGKPGRLQGKIAVVTGGAQGFGKGIAESLAREGALVVVADLNAEGAEEIARGICKRHGDGRGLAVRVDISNEESVENMTREIVARCGGIDLFVANAGVLRAGSVKTMSLKEWDFVTRVNYTGYFLCVKHVSRVMAAQNVERRGSWMDIIQINSKSGLEGSNKNAAYAGGKFGGIGQTQSYAKELVADRIKVNAICPGNYFEGPLWSDPVHGLFRQYLDTGKVPGAKTIEDVRRHYEAQVPMGRGCTPEDVVKAILYCVEQEYETGQAIAVTGGQVMLH